MVANNFLQDVAACPLVFPSESASSGAPKAVLPPVEEILDVVDSDDEGMGSEAAGSIATDKIVLETMVGSVAAGSDMGVVEGLDIVTGQVAADACGGAEHVGTASKMSNESTDVAMEAAPQ